MARPRYIITVDRSRIDQGRPETIRVERAADGHITWHEQVTLPDGAVVLTGPPRQDGARVWIETDRVTV